MMSDRVVISWEECRNRFRNCVDKFNKNLSKEFGIDIDIGDEEWSDLFDELVDKHIEFDDE